MTELTTSVLSALNLLAFNQDDTNSNVLACCRQMGSQAGYPAAIGISPVFPSVSLNSPE
ncbi:hypothetical protein [Serratia sp. DD3]|uniref:hypothetical protein n=1 Tax=Serratia sp. DD3 TaxID=1410619 RepID=UPI0003F8E28B|nr:hypothetical protein [Serratia sp. DD3]